MQGAGEVLLERDQRTGREATALIGMIAALASWGMMFAGLFFAFGLGRVRADMWPPPNVPVLPLGLPLINTVVIGASSIALVYGLSQLRRGNTARLTTSLWVSAALGLAFVALQLVLWSAMWNDGLRPSSGQYGALFYMLTWVHAAHVAIGVIALFWMAVRATNNAYSPAQYSPVRLWSLYWHFVGVVWVAMFVLVFLA